MTSKRKPPSKTKSSEAQPQRFGALARLPLFFALNGKRATIAGGGPAAAWKAELLSASGAAVDVYTVDACSEMMKLASDAPVGDVIVHGRVWTAADLDGAVIAVGDFRDNDGAAAFCRAARAAGVPVNVIDQPDFCDFTFGAIVNRSPLVIGISTDGAAPVFAQAIRGKIEALLPKAFARWTAAAARWRGAAQVSGLSFSGRRKFWQLFTARALANPDSEPRQHDFDRFIAGALRTGSGIEHGSVTVVDIDRNEPDLLTLRAVRALHSADAIVFDARVSREVFDFARREARKIPLAPVSDDGFRKQREISALIVNLAKQGKRVVIIKCCDPRIIARPVEELDACRAANIPTSLTITAFENPPASLSPNSRLALLSP